MDKKRIYTMGIAALAVLGIIVACFMFLRPSAGFEAVPNSAVAVIEVHNWVKFADKLNTSYTGMELKKTHAVARLQTQLNSVSKLLSGTSTVGAVNSGKTIASMHLTSAEDFDYLYTTHIKLNDNTLLNHIQSSPHIRSVKVRIFKKQRLLDITLRSGEQLTVANLKGVLAFSFTSFLTEASVSSLLTSNSINADKLFTATRKKASHSSDVTLYFNFNKWNVILPVLVKMQSATLLADMQDAAAWGAFSIKLDNDEIHISGVSVNKEKPARHPIDKAHLATIFKSIPANAAVAYVHATDTSVYSGNELLGGYFSNWVGPAVAFVTLEPLRQDYADQNMFIALVENKQRAVSSLKKLMQADGGNTAPVDTFRQNEIYYLPNGSAINQVFGNAFTRLDKVWFMVQNDVAFFANNINVLKVAIERLQNPEKSTTSIKIQGDNAAILYVNPQRCGMLWPAFFKPGATTEAFLQNFSDVVATSNVSDGKIEMNITMKTGGGQVAEGLLWKTKLKTMALTAPQVVNNSNGQNEVFVQDTAFNIYLLDNSGNILFTRNIGEAVVGDVKQLDYYNNGERQLIFAASQHIYIIDHSGNDVASYPIRLSYPATAGITLVTDSLTNTYRYFVPCLNRAVYGYQGNGRPLSGFSPKNGVGIVEHPLTYFIKNRREYIAAFNNAGTLSLFDLKGNRLWSVENLATTHPPVLLNTDSAQFISASATTLSVINTAGAVQTNDLIDTAYNFTATTTSDSDYIYFFSNATEIRSYNNAHQFQKSIALKNVYISNLSINQSGNQKYVVVADVDGKINVLNTGLKELASFTLSNHFVVADLYARNQLITITTDVIGNITCTRLK